MLDRAELERAIVDTERSLRTYDDIERLAHFTAVYEQFFGNPEQVPQTIAETELTDVFPALEQYQRQHTAINLKRLCQEVAEFCRSIYATTENEAERTIYREAFKRI